MTGVWMRVLECMHRCADRSRGEGENIGRVCRTWVLHDEYLGASERVHRRVVAMGLPAHRKDPVLVGVPGARHAGGDQAHEHPSRSIWARRSTKGTGGHILGIPGEVGAAAPDGGTCGAGGQRLEALDGIAHDGVRVSGAMEEPASVHAGDKLETHGLEGAAHRVVVRLDPAVLLHAVLNALDLGQPHPRPLLPGGGPIG
mmetsp:Transcript_1108/g.4620  ORF Transcript_1108/g.4620 Transcript_1108/m.4620 type:complete len:200 (+) Transcript_1108:84-683(+)